MSNTEIFPAQPNELEIIPRSRIPGVNLFFNTVDYRTPHFHPEWELIWVLDEPLAVESQGQTVIAPPGALLLFSPEQVHEFRRTHNSVTFLCFQVSPGILPMQERYFDGIVLPPEICPPLKSAMTRAAGSYFDGGELSGLQCLEHIYSLCGLLFSCLPTQPVTAESRSSRTRQIQRLTRLMQFVDENYMHKLRLSDFAEAEKLSVSYVSSFVRRTMNRTFQDYVNEVRVNSACQRMASSGGNMTEIALESGFSDYRYFSAAFKERFGMTPEQYRRSAPAQGAQTLHRSIHSQERRYSISESRAMLDRLNDEGNPM